MLRRVFLAGAVAASPGSAVAQAVASFAEIAGRWEGHVSPAFLKLDLTLSAEGRYTLLMIGAQASASETGMALLKDGQVVVAIPGGDMKLTLVEPGKLSGPYANLRNKGTATLTRR